jgi:hypothetical protein
MIASAFPQRSYLPLDDGWLLASSGKEKVFYTGGGARC